MQTSPVACHNEVYIQWMLQRYLSDLMHVSTLFVYCIDVVCTGIMTVCPHSGRLHALTCRAGGITLAYQSMWYCMCSACASACAVSKHTCSGCCKRFQLSAARCHLAASSESDASTLLACYLPQHVVCMCNVKAYMQWMLQTLPAASNRLPSSYQQRVRCVNTACMRWHLPQLVITQQFTTTCGMHTVQCPSIHAVDVANASSYQ
jgi:hypothetical protein